MFTRWPMRGCVPSASICSSSGASASTLRALPEGILELRQLCHEARVALEELGELVFAQLPR
jgi:hypothetical protein